MENKLLARLTQAERTRLEQYLEPVALEGDGVLYDQGERLDYVYFPLCGVVSVVARMNGNAGVEIGAVGNDGMVGTSAVLGVPVVASRFVVQVPGQAVRMRLEQFQKEMAAQAELHRLVQHYTHWFLFSSCQSVACFSRHTMRERCCRWLLGLQDRMASAELGLTQEFLAQVLCVRRATVTGIAQQLQRDGLIRYKRGRMTILNRPGLESCACECYATIRSAFEQLLS